MTLVRSITLSMSLHILLFGTGYAFARFSAPQPRQVREHTIMISLRDESTSRGAVINRHVPSSRNDAQRSSYPGPEESTVSLPQDNVQPATEGIVHTEQDRSAGEQGREGRPEADDAGIAGSSASGEAQAAVITAEQWTTIVSAIEQTKSYPRLARQRGIEGVVKLRFRIDPSGFAEQIEIIQSSGHEILDGASVRSVHRAGPLPHLPGWVEVPIAYVLQ